MAFNGEERSWPERRRAREIFERLRAEPWPFLLESGRSVRGMGRYSFFGADPFLTLSVTASGCSIFQNGVLSRSSQPPLNVLRGLLSRYRLQGVSKQAPPLLCGAVGFFSYDFGLSFEKIKTRHESRKDEPLAVFGFYDTIFCLDHHKDRLSVYSCGFPETGFRRRKRALERLAWAGEILSGFSKIRPIGPLSVSRPVLSSNLSRKDYCQKVSRAKEYISKGDIYQVNLSQKFKLHGSVDDWRLYECLARRFPVSYAAYLNFGDWTLISASPERFLCCDGRMVSTRPMKGTRPKTGNLNRDAAMKSQLIRSAKEKAELLMIVDLERNDLGRVCSYGSVEVSRLRVIEPYRSVFQATAEIRGVLYSGCDRLDLIRACFPGGSVTGCPKIRSMEIIDELEPDPRQAYTGALGYLSFHDTMDFNILIRTFLLSAQGVSFHVGGGIVADSHPEKEYRETLVKARVLLEALSDATHQKVVLA